ncbi:hypothetical protein [Fundicoccus ignavus]|uniref:hypothetical protein n=1 Tax=Fundicoccus ignavus TaxID=2664442 RepID=UPI00129CDCB8|nr:hypothetical protein [Fundicoccus ignavus]
MSFAASSRRLKKRGSGIIVVLARHRLYLAILGFSRRSAGTPMAGGFSRRTDGDPTERAKSCSS